MDKKLIELLNRIGSDKELVSNFSLSLKTGKHLNITGLCGKGQKHRGLLCGIYRWSRHPSYALRIVSRKR